MPLLDVGAVIALGFQYFTIIYITAIGGLFSERSGIVNIGLEGLMISGTVMGAWGTIHWGPVAGLAIGAASGMLFSLVHAVATVTFRVDHIVSGVVINVVAIGLARFLSQLFFGSSSQSDSGLPHIGTVDIPVLEGLPLGLGRAFQGISPITIVAFLLAIPVLYVLNRTRFGLRLRSAGENPEATRTLGVRVAPLRYAGVALSGTLAGFAGAFLSVEVNQLYQEGQTQGLGFIALASLILGNWSPLRVMLGAFLFGLATGIPLRVDLGLGAFAGVVLAFAVFVTGRYLIGRLDLGLAERGARILGFVVTIGAALLVLVGVWLLLGGDVRIPAQFVRMIPYIVTIVAIAGFVGRVHPPAAAGKAYEGAGGT